MLTVLCPDSLADSPDLTKAQEQLAARLRYARRTRQHSASDDAQSRVTPIEHWLASHFQLPASMMVGAFSRYNEIPSGSVDTDHALTITPAHLHAGRDHLVLQPIRAVTPTTSEANKLVAAANDFLREDGIQLEIVTPQTWLLHSPQPFDVALSSSAMAAGRSVEIYMPAGNDGRRLRALLNELQMLWHDHPVNHARDAAQQLRINTVWAEGWAAPIQAPRGLQQVFTDDLALRGLARVCQIEPGNAADGAGTETASQPTLIQLKDGAQAALNFLDQHQAQPLTIVLSSSVQWIELTVRPNDRLRRWRRNPLHP